jgi:hypothetical protein
VLQSNINNYLRATKPKKFETLNAHKFTKSSGVETEGMCVCVFFVCDDKYLLVARVVGTFTYIVDCITPRLGHMLVRIFKVVGTIWRMHEKDAEVLRLYAEI